MIRALHVVILAAGVGTRMKSKKLKVLHSIAGVPMVEHVYRLALSLSPRQITLVYGHQGEQLKSHFEGQSVNWAKQDQQLGTGHALQQAVPFFNDDEQVLVLYGDVPLVQSSDLVDRSTDQFVLTAEVIDPTGYGRIIKSAHGIDAIIEEKDATTEQKRIKEINSGIIQAPAHSLKKWLSQISNDNQQKEYYLTDVIALAAKDGQPFETICLTDAQVVKGANDMVQLAELESIMQQRLRRQLMISGVRLLEPESIDIRGHLECGQDVVIDKGVVLEGSNYFADDVRIGAHSVLVDCCLAKGTVVKPHSVLEGVTTTGACEIGPFARLRTGTELAAGAKIGNFVETKKTRLGQNSKVNHLSYLGDTEVGQNVNVGAGTITCNYDGVNKFKTIIGDGAFIGSDSQLVAPVSIGSGATIGAGSTITKNAPAGELTLSRTEQHTIQGWKKPKKK